MRKRQLPELEIPETARHFAHEKIIIMLSNFAKNLIYEVLINTQQEVGEYGRKM